jgi:hypothetical protein
VNEYVSNVLVSLKIKDMRLVLTSPHSFYRSLKLMTMYIIIKISCPLALDSLLFQKCYLNRAKVEDATDLRHQGRSCSQLLRALDNKGDGVSSAFTEGKQNGDKLLITIIHL